MFDPRRYHRRMPRPALLLLVLATGCGSSSPASAISSDASTMPDAGADAPPSTAANGTPDDQPPGSFEPGMPLTSLRACFHARWTTHDMDR